jgi:hypothetical protein
MHLKFSEVLNFLQRFEHFAMDFSGKVYFTFNPIAKAEPKCVPFDMAGFNDMHQHLRYSKGSIRASGRLATASAHVSSNS